MEKFLTLKQYATSFDYKIIESLFLEDLFDIICEYYESDCLSGETITRLIHTHVNGIIDMYTGKSIMRIARIAMKYKKKGK